MAGYTAAINLARSIGADEVVGLLQKSLSEEIAADKKLQEISSNLVKRAAAAAA